MKIAVTGASGHVGGNLCRELVRKGHKVKALVHKDDRSIQGLDLELVQGDLTEPDSLEELCKDTEVVFHLAALISVNGDKQQLERINVQGTQNLINVLSQSNGRRLIHFSSIHALDHNPLDKPMDENNPLVTHALMMYETTKVKGDKIVLEGIRNGLDAVIVNPSAIIGPNDFKPSLIGQVILKLYKGSLPALVPGGYDFVDVRDVVQASIAAIDKARKGERYILSGKWVSVRDLAKTLERVTEKKIVQRTVPLSLAKLGVPFFKIYSKISGQHPLYTTQSLDIIMSGNRQIMSDKACHELNYNPRPLEETLCDTVNWYKENGYLK